MFKPLFNRVLVKSIDDLVSKSGIVIVQNPSKKEPPSKGVVLEVGEGVNGIPMVVKVGDIVFFEKYAANNIKLDNQDLIIISETDILCVLEEDNV